jgi:hypothetical protein
MGCNSIPLRNILEDIFTSTVAIWLKANRIEERLEKRRKEGWCRHRRRMLVS